ncbi:hypothetical protein ACP6L2_17180 [Sphingobacterium lactis]|uniref:hypothetical protein n=1 Tax=Sphingobacterium lactis TaxID=797291 RepID=UPI003F7E08BA
MNILIYRANYMRILMLVVCLLFARESFSQNYSYYMDERGNGIKTLNFSVSTKKTYNKKEEKLTFRIIYSPISVLSHEGYRYNGKVYREEVPGLMEALRRVKVINPTVTMSLMSAGNRVQNGDKKIILSYTSDGGFALSDEISFNNISEQMHYLYTLEMTKLHQVQYAGADTYVTFESLIENYLGSKEKITVYNKWYHEGETLFNQERYAEAKESFMLARNIYQGLPDALKKDVPPHSNYDRLQNFFSKIAEKEREKEKELGLVVKDADKKEKKEEAKKNSSPDDDLIRFYALQRMKVENAINRAKQSLDIADWQYAQQVRDEVFAVSGWNVINSTMDKEIKDGLRLSQQVAIASEIFEHVNAAEFEVFFGRQKSKESWGSDYSEIGLNVRYILNLNQPYINPYFGGGFNFIEFAPYRISYVEVPQNEKNLPSDQSNIYKNRVMYFNASLGLHGEIPIDKANYPHHSFSVSWFGGGTAGYGIGDGLDDYTFTFSNYDFSNELLFGIRGGLGINIYLTENFGFGFTAGINHHFIKKQYENSLVGKSKNYPVNLTYAGEKQHIFFGIKFIL